jgi:hypothetical protein
MRWLLRPSEVRSRYSCTTYLASGNCKTSSIPLLPPTAADSLATGPTAPNTPPSADNTLLKTRISSANCPRFSLRPSWTSGPDRTPGVKVSLACGEAVGLRLELRRVALR